jgi:hypothetical protein
MDIDCVICEVRAVVRYTYLRTYLLTPWSIVLLEKLTGLQLVVKYTRR